MHHTQAIEIFDNVSSPFDTLTITENFTEIVPGNPSVGGGVKCKRVGKYSDFGPVEGHYLENGARYEVSYY